MSDIEILTDPNLGRSCADSQSYNNFINTMAMSFLKRNTLHFFMDSSSFYLAFKILLFPNSLISLNFGRSCTCD